MNTNIFLACLPDNYRKAFSFLICTGLFLFLSASATAQVIRFGLTAGPQLSWLSLDSDTFKDSVSVSPMLGFRFGGVVSFKVRDRYYLHTEYVYSVKGRNMKGKIDDFLSDKVKSTYAEVTALYTVQFKGHFRDKDFKWYLGAGPSVNYWVSAKGTIFTSDLHENNVGSFDYTAKFGPRKYPGNTLYASDVYYTDANRWQWGLNFGGGILLEPGDNKIMVDLRISIDHTRLGNRTADFFNPIDYDDNLRARYRCLRLSLIYMLEYNLSKQERHKGKSTVKGAKHR